MRRLITAALLALALGSAQAATQMEQLAKQMHPSEFPAQIEKLLNSGKAAQALELADLGIRKNERSPQLRFMRAVALENLTRSEEAVRELKQLIIDYPEIPAPDNTLAVIEPGLGTSSRPCASTPTSRLRARTSATCISRSPARPMNRPS